jgi:hypothetical protein
MRGTGSFGTEVISANTRLADALSPLCAHCAYIMVFREISPNCETKYYMHDMTKSPVISIFTGFECLINYAYK